MANLIIKSSADNLVLQGSDASPAITVAAAGTTTFAENATLSGTANNLGTATAGTLSSGVTFPAGHIIKTHHKAFLGVQAISSLTSSNTQDWSTDPDKWVLIGTGASGDSGDPLLITTGTPHSSSSKYLLRANVTHSRLGASSYQMKWWYRVAGTGAYAPIVQGEDDAVSANWTRYAFGSDHHSSGSGHGSRQGSGEYLWSPGTNNSYDIQIMLFSYSDDAYINRPSNGDAYSYMGNAISTLTIQEVAS